MAGKVRQVTNRRPTAFDVEAWVAKRKAWGLPVPRQDAGTPRAAAQGSVLGAVAGAMDLPRELTLPRSKELVRVDEPFLRDWKALLSTLPLSVLESGDLREILSGLGGPLQTLMLGCVEIYRAPGDWEKGTLDWFDGLRGSDAALLLETWLSSVDATSLQGKFDELRGKIQGAVAVAKAV